jgi:fructose-1,6-bisphosphatase/inositol monophosphatase family enzyme
VGVIACHAVGETVAAAAGLGAWMGERRVRVSRVAQLAEATVTTTSYARLAEIHPAAFAALTAPGVSGLARAWGDCYGYLMVATGRAEAMLDPELNLWDVAALYPVIREAGGRITAWDGTAGPGTSAVATNGLVHDEMLALLR